MGSAHATQESAKKEKKAAWPPYLQNRELSWLTFDERVLDQGADETVPLLERLNFISIFSSNLQEFFMVRVGSLTDLSLLKKPLRDSKTGMTPEEQLNAVYERCHQLYPQQEAVFNQVRAQLAEQGVHHLHVSELDEDQRAALDCHVETNVMPFLSPQIVNSRHPFPHLENGALYVVVRLDETALSPAEGAEPEPEKGKKGKKEKKKGGAEGTTLGLVPLPRQCKRVVQVPGDGVCFVLLEEAIEYAAAKVFSMYKVKHTNIICVTRNADLDTGEGTDESDEDYREHMKRILKKRARLAPVRLESARPLSTVVSKTLMERLGLQKHQVFVTSVPLDMGYTWGLGGLLSPESRANLSNPPFTPAWPVRLKRGKSLIKQVTKRDVLLSYPYESMDPFVDLLREASVDPDVVSIRITLYRLASVSRLAEALIAAAENGKEVTALFELRARFDESNNIAWSQRFEEAGCRVIYGFRDYKVHSKICSITRQTEKGIQLITQVGTGNYNEKTARLYTDFSYITADPSFGMDAVEFFRNMALENAADTYKTLWVAPLQMKANVLAGIDDEIQKAREGKPCGLFFKTNSVTDKEIIEKIVEASQAGVPTTLLVRGISCLVPGIAGYTENVKVFSIVGRLLEHSRIYCFGQPRSADLRMYCSSADLMTRNMDKRVEVAWPIANEAIRLRIEDYLLACLQDTAKLRELLPDGTYTPLRYFAEEGEEPFDSQAYHIWLARRAADEQERDALELRAARSESDLVMPEPEAGQAVPKPMQEQKAAAVPVEAAEEAPAAAAPKAAAAEPAPEPVAIPDAEPAEPAEPAQEAPAPKPAPEPAEPEAAEPAEPAAKPAASEPAQEAPAPKPAPEPAQEADAIEDPICLTAQPDPAQQVHMPPAVQPVRKESLLARLLRFLFRRK